MVSVYWLWLCLSVIVEALLWESVGRVSQAHNPLNRKPVMCVPSKALVLMML